MPWGQEKGTFLYMQCLVHEYHIVTKFEVVIHVVNEEVCRNPAPVSEDSTITKQWKVAPKQELKVSVASYVLQSGFLFLLLPQSQYHVAKHMVLKGSKGKQREATKHNWHGDKSQQETDLLRKYILCYIFRKNLFQA